MTTSLSTPATLLLLMRLSASQKPLSNSISREPKTIEKSIIKKPVPNCEQVSTQAKSEPTFQILHSRAKSQQPIASNNSVLNQHRYLLPHFDSLPPSLPARPRMLSSLPVPRSRVY